MELLDAAAGVDGQGAVFQTGLHVVMLYVSALQGYRGQAGQVAGSPVSESGRRLRAMANPSIWVRKHEWRRQHGTKDIRVGREIGLGVPSAILTGASALPTKHAAKRQGWDWARAGESGERRLRRE